MPARGAAPADPDGLSIGGVVAWLALFLADKTKWPAVARRLTRNDFPVRQPLPWL